MMKKIKQALCSHNYEELEGRSGYISSGVEILELYFKCKKCKKVVYKPVVRKDHWTEEERVRRIISELNN